MSRPIRQGGVHVEGGYWIAIGAWTAIAVALSVTGLVLHLRERRGAGK